MIIDCTVNVEEEWRFDDCTVTVDQEERMDVCTVTLGEEGMINRPGVAGAVL